MYKCTALRDKYLQATIVIDNKEKPCEHPIYQFLNDQNRVSSKLFPVNEYSST